MSRQWWNIYSR